MELELRTENLGILHYTAIILALISAGIHLYLAPQIGLNTLGVSFALAGLGFLVGITALLFDYRRTLVYLLGIPFTLGQIVIWYYMNRPQLEHLIRGEPFLDVIDKISQILLIILLIYFYFDERNLEMELPF